MISAAATTLKIVATMAAAEWVAVAVLVCRWAAVGSASAPSSCSALSAMPSASTRAS
jgi:hypothetical protein